MTNTRKAGIPAPQSLCLTLHVKTDILAFYLPGVYFVNRKLKLRVEGLIYWGTQGKRVKFSSTRASVRILSTSLLGSGEVTGVCSNVPTSLRSHSPGLHKTDEKLGAIRDNPLYFSPCHYRPTIRKLRGISYHPHNTICCATSTGCS